MPLLQRSKGSTLHDVGTQLLMNKTVHVKCNSLAKQVIVTGDCAGAGTQHVHGMTDTYDSLFLSFACRLGFICLYIL